MTTVTGADSWVCLFWVAILFLCVCFYSRFAESVMAVCFLFFWSAQLLCSQASLLVLEVDMQQLAVGREVKKGWSVVFTEDVGRHKEG